MPVTTRNVRGVVVNGSLPINFVPTVQTLHLALGSNGVVVATVVGSSGQPIDLANSAAALSIKRYESDPAPLIQRLGVVQSPSTGGVVEFALSPNDTIVALGAAGNYVYDVTITFGDGDITQVVPSSSFVVDAAVGSPTAQTTAPIPSQTGQAGKLLGTDGTNFAWLYPPHARGVVTANIADLTAFVVADSGGSRDGLTYVAGDVVMLAKQTDKTQNGPWLVGTVVTGTAPLTRPPEWASGSIINRSVTIEIGPEGTHWHNGTWKINATGTDAGALTVDTSNVVFLPRIQIGQTNLSGGTAVVSGVWANIGGAFGAFVIAQDVTNPAAIASGEITTPGGVPTLTLTGTTNDTVSWMITNF